MRPDRLPSHHANGPQARVEHRVVGDHLFIICSRGRELQAGPGDWLVAGADGAVEVERGDYRRRAERAIRRAKAARLARSDLLQTIQGLKPTPVAGVSDDGRRRVAGRKLVRNA